MPSVVIKAIEYADGRPCPMGGLFLSRADANSETSAWTPDLGLARHFANNGEAFDFWRRQSNANPHRLDGRPNRPLTKITVELMPVPEAEP
jgi:hypothetical protein